MKKIVLVTISLANILIGFTALADSTCVGDGMKCVFDPATKKIVFEVNGKRSEEKIVRTEDIPNKDPNGYESWQHVSNKGNKFVSKLGGPLSARNQVVFENKVYQVQCEYRSDEREGL